MLIDGTQDGEQAEESPPRLLVTLDDLQNPASAASLAVDAAVNAALSHLNKVPPTTPAATTTVTSSSGVQGGQGESHQSHVGPSVLLLSVSAFCLPVPSVEVGSRALYPLAAAFELPPTRPPSLKAGKRSPPNRGRRGKKGSGKQGNQAKRKMVCLGQTELARERESPVFKQRLQIDYRPRTEQRIKVRLLWVA